MDVVTKEAVLKLAGYECIEDDGWEYVWRDAENPHDWISWSHYSYDRCTIHAYNAFLTRQNEAS